MPLSTTTIGDNSQTPGSAAEIYNPDQLIAGNLKIVSDTVTLGAGVLARGAVLGIITASGNYINCLKGAADGSQNPVAILADAADASGGAVFAPVYLTGEFNTNAMVIDASWTIAQMKAAIRPQGIFLKSALSAADPT
jgi:hypothetical protein